MSETKKLIASLDQKVEQLLSNIKEQQATLDKKQGEVDELNKKASDNELKVQELKAKNDSLKSNPAESNEDSEEMKVKISELVKEIDNCISLLKV